MRAVCSNNTMFLADNMRSGGDQLRLCDIEAMTAGACRKDIDLRRIDTEDMVGLCVPVYLTSEDPSLVIYFEKENDRTVCKLFRGRSQASIRLLSGGAAEFAVKVAGLMKVPAGVMWKVMSVLQELVKLEIEAA